MPRSKTQISRLPKDLRDPIEWGDISLPDYMKPGRFDAWWRERLVFALSERLRKMELLMDVLEIPPAERIVRVTALCLMLAEKLYPGFRTTLDGKKQGRPRRGADGDQLPPWAVLIMIDGMLKEGLAKTDLEACKRWLGYDDKNKNLSRSELEKKAKSLASVISTLRSLGRKKAANQVN
jgi:hypothetical protein